jgi:hypothetical protein
MAIKLKTLMEVLEKIRTKKSGSFLLQIGMERFINFKILITIQGKDIQILKVALNPNKSLSH